MRRPTAVLLSCLGLAACSPTAITVKNYTDRDYSAAAHYAWASEPGGVEVTARGVNPVAVGESVREAIERALRRKGLSESPAGEADILIRYFAALEDVAGAEADYRYIGDDPFATAGGSVTDVDPLIPDAGPRRLRDYEEGRLVVEAFDARTSELIWRGTARAPVSVTEDPDAAGRRLDRTLERLFEKFPP